MKTKQDLLSNLPNDLGQIILNQLPPYSFLSIASTNKKFAQMAKSEEMSLKRIRSFH